MMLAIESLVRTFEDLLLKASRRNVQHVLRATNDNDEASGDERRYATYR